MRRIGGAAINAAKRADSNIVDDYEGAGGTGQPNLHRTDTRQSAVDAFDSHLSDIFQNQRRTSKEIIQSRFNMFVGVVILANAIVIALETDMQGLRVWYYFENFFISFFSLELIVRLYWERCSYFTSSWNLLDFTCISTSITDAWVLRPMTKGSDSSGLRILSVLRVLRLFRLVRLLRIFKMFHDLYTVVCAFGSSLQSIMWVTVLLVLGLFFCAILITQALGQNPEFSDLEIGDGETTEDRFGTVSGSMFSLFELLTMEGWTDVGRPLVNKSPWIILFFIAFFMIFSFGLMSMIIGLVVDRTIQYSQTNTFTVEREKKNQKKDVVESLKAFFLASDANGDGMLSLSELQDALKSNEEVRAALEKCEIPVEMWRDFFDVLDTEKKGEVTVEQFLKGVDRLKGEARGKDLVATQITMSQIHNNQEILLDHLDSMEREQEDILQRLKGVEEELTFGGASCLSPQREVDIVSKACNSSSGSHIASNTCDKVEASKLAPQTTGKLSL